MYTRGEREVVCAVSARVCARRARGCVRRARGMRGERGVVVRVWSAKSASLVRVGRARVRVVREVAVCSCRVARRARRKCAASARVWVCGEREGMRGERKSECALERGEGRMGAPCARGRVWEVEAAALGARDVSASTCLRVVRVLGVLYEYREPEYIPC